MRDNLFFSAAMRTGEPKAIESDTTISSIADEENKHHSPSTTAEDTAAAGKTRYIYVILYVQ